mmetsp:Transcript_8324/g.15121  ORF Transcript_8324/g.15121 Transcript_8324/m.15121 type:complete len:301 (-) Transcript_8324:64-966(-)
MALRLIPALLGRELDGDARRVHPPVVQGDTPLGPEDLADLRHLALPAWKGQHRGALVWVVDHSPCARGAVARRGDSSGGLRSKEERSKLHSVADLRKVRLDHAHLADNAQLDRSAGVLHGREVAGPHSFDECNSLGLRGRVELSSIGCGHGQRLLAKHMLPGPDCHQGLLLVKRRDGSDIHDINTGVRDQGFVVRGHLLHAMLGGELRCFRRIPRGAGLENGPRHFLEALAPIRGNGPAAQDSPAQLVRHILGLGQAQADVQRRGHAAVPLHAFTVTPSWSPSSRQRPASSCGLQRRAES